MTTPWIAIGFLALAAMFDAHRTRTERTAITEPLAKTEPLLGP